MNSRRKSPTKKRNAFSLIEVTMAMGLVSFAVITVMGLMPVGLVALNRAIASTEQAQIVRQLSAQAVLTPYQSLSDSFGGTTFYYDGEGVLLASSPATSPIARPADTRYWATTKVMTPVYPGSSSATGLTGSLHTVHIELMSGAGSQASSTNFYNIEVPNSGN